MVFIRSWSPPPAWGCQTEGNRSLRHTTHPGGWARMTRRLSFQPRLGLPSVGPHPAADASCLAQRRAPADILRRRHRRPRARGRRERAVVLHLRTSRVRCLLASARGKAHDGRTRLRSSTRGRPMREKRSSRGPSVMTDCRWAGRRQLNTRAPDFQRARPAAGVPRATARSVTRCAGAQPPPPRRPGPPRRPRGRAV